MRSAPTPSVAAPAELARVAAKRAKAATRAHRNATRRTAAPTQAESTHRRRNFVPRSDHQASLTTPRNLLVETEQVTDHAFVGQAAACNRSPRTPHPACASRVRKHRFDRRSEGRRAAGNNNQTALAVCYELRHAADARRDDGHTRRHRLDHGKRASLVVAGKDEARCSRKKLRNV